MTLSDLVDVEMQLARDRGTDPLALEARDRGLLSAGDRAGSRTAVLRRWLDALRARDPGAPWPGGAVAAALRALRTALVVVGLGGGWATASAVLQFTGGHPVNVWDFLLVFVGIQLLLLGLLALSALLGGRAAGSLGLLRGAARALHHRLVSRALRADARVEDWRAVWHALRTRRSLYHAVEPWALLLATQSFGVAFNLAALASCLRLVVFSDVAFSWSTTLADLDPGRFHAIVRALAAPWGWAWPDAVPSTALVAATRYSRLEGAYLLSDAGRAARPEVVGGWWPFLVAALLCYGLLPRAALLVAARLRVARLLARLPFEDPQVSRLLDRLTAPDVQTRSPSPDPAGAPWPAPGADAAARPPDPTRCVTVLWRDVPADAALQAAVARHVRCGASTVAVAGGRDYDEGRVDWKRVTDGSDAVVVVAEGWEPPDRGVLRLVSTLRGALGDARHVRVLLVGPSAAGRVTSASSEDVRLWREGLARLADPHVAVEPLREGP